MSEQNNSAAAENESLRSPALVIPALIVLLLAGAIVFFKERMLFIDAPHVLFRIINDGRLMISDFRYGSFVTQMFPWAGAQLHLPLMWLMVLYSASFYLFYLTVALLLVFRFKNYGLAILFGLYLVLFVSDTFYWPNNEVHQGIGWLMIALGLNFSIAARQTPLFIAIPVFAATCFLALWTHPLVMLVAVYLWFFFWLDKRYWPFSRNESLIYTAILLLLSFRKFYQGMHHGYDSTKIELITGVHANAVKQLLTSPQLHFFIKSCFTDYWVFLVLFVAGMLALIKAKKYLLFFWTLLFASGYLALLCITFQDTGSNKFYIESEYMPLSIICTASFVYYALPMLSRRLGVSVLIAVCSIRLIYIFAAAPAFSNRVAIMNHINTKMSEKSLTKIIIPEPVPAVDNSLIMNWGAPVESILISQLNGEKPQRTFIFANSDEAKVFQKTGKDTLIGCWDMRPNSKINHIYFQADTTVLYQVISYEDLMK